VRIPETVLLDGIFTLRSVKEEDATKKLKKCEIARQEANIGGNCYSDW
jgi:UDP-galactopyranose mutase